MRRLAGLLLLAALAACSDGDAGGMSPLAKQGERVYQNICITCHNSDPSQDGTVGPAIAGSSAELLEARLIHGTYPKGYTPKRPGSTVMPKFEYLADQIPALAAYLSEVGDHAGQSARASH